MAPGEPTRIDPDTSVPITAWAFDAAPDAPVAIGIADFTAGGLWFGDLAESLDGRVRVIAPDLRGRAASMTAPPPGSIDDHACDVLGLADRCDAATFTLVGHGTGAAVALAVAALAPTRMSRLVLLDGPPTPSPRADGDWITAASAVDPGVERLRHTWAHRDAALRDDLASGRVPHTGLTRSLRRALDAEVTGSGFAWRARLSVGILEHDWARLVTWRPPLLDDTIPVSTIRARHGHRDDEPSIAVLGLDAEVQTAATTHSGLLVDRAALRALVEAIPVPGGHR